MTLFHVLPDDVVRLNCYAKIIHADITTTNGVVHIIDRFLPDTYTWGSAASRLLFLPANFVKMPVCDCK